MNLWGLFVFAFLLLALFFDVKAVHVALVATGLLYFAGGAVLERALARLRVERGSDRAYLFPGERAEIAVRFVNDSIVPIPWLAVHDHMPERLARGTARRWVHSVPPRGKAEYRYAVTSSARGVYVVGPVELALGDPLGLHRRSGTAPSYQEVVVYPEILALPELGLPSDLPVGNAPAPAPVYRDPARIAGIRAYAPGDVLQSIHWKATARTGRLQVKQYEHTVSLDAVLFLNFGAEEYVAADGSYLDSELAVTAAASLANHLAMRGESFGFVTNAALVRRGAGGGAEPSGGRGESESVAERSGRAHGERSAGAEAEGRRGAEGRTEAEAPGIVRVPPRKGNRQLMRVLEILAAAEPRPAREAGGLPFHRLVADEARNCGVGATLLVVTPAAGAEWIETSEMLRRSGYKVLLFATAGGRFDAPAKGRTRSAVYRVRKERDGALQIEAATMGVAGREPAGAGAGVIKPAERERKPAGGGSAHG